MFLGEGIETFQANASMDFMVRALGETEDQRLTTIIKSPTSTTLADLAGAWRLTGFLTPDRLVENFWNGMTQQSRTSDQGVDFAQTDEQLVDVYFPEIAETPYGIIGISETGAVSGLATGTASVASPSRVDLNLTGDDGMLSFYPTANHNVMVGLTVDGGEQELILLLRVPVEPMKMVLDTEGEGIGLIWQGRSDVKLQKASTLGSWSDVIASQVQSAYRSEAMVEFYRLIQVAAP